jgi:hypothetical protein
VTRARSVSAFPFVSILLFGFCTRASATSVPLQGKFPPELSEARSAGVFTISSPPAGGETSRPQLHPFAAASGAQGTWRIPVILVSFSDQAPAYPPQRFQTLLFDTLGVNPHGSLAEYYRSVSRGALRIVGDVYGWYALPHSRNFYANDGYGVSRIGAPRNDAGLVQDALAAADGDVDFSRYDRDGDGVVDYVMVAHVGSGAEAVSGDRTQLWSINSSLEGAWDGVGPYETEDPRPGSGGLSNMKVKRFSI